MSKSIKDQQLDYLDRLRESGVTNMLGAAPYLQREFGLPIEAARAVLDYWMNTFADRQMDRIVVRLNAEHEKENQ